MATEHDCGTSMGYHQNHVVIAALTTGASAALLPRRPGSFKTVASTLLLVTQQNNPAPPHQLSSFNLIVNYVLEKPNLLLNPTAHDHTNILKLNLLIHYKQKKTLFNWVKQLKFCNFQNNYVIKMEVAKPNMEVAKPKIKSLQKPKLLNPS